MDKREKEKQIVKLMIEIYCHKNHQKDGLCDDCRTLLEYANMRLDKCPFIQTKTFCSNCRVHCYRSDMRKKIKNVMRFSGPRMLLYHPFTAIKHCVESIKEKRRRA